MRPSHSTRRADETDALAALHRVALRDERLGEMEVARDDTAAVIYVDDPAGEKERVHQRDDAAVGREHGRAGVPTKVDAQMPARDHAIEHAPRPERARDLGVARHRE